MVLTTPTATMTAKTAIPAKRAIQAIKVKSRDISLRLRYQIEFAASILIKAAILNNKPKKGRRIFLTILPCKCADSLPVGRTG